MHALLHSVPPNLQQATANPRFHRRPPDTHRQVRNCLLWGHCSFFWVLLCTLFCLCPLGVCFPVLCKSWQLWGGVNGDLLLEGLCHTQVYCTQSPCSCSSPLLTHTSTGHTQTQFWLSLGAGLCVLVCTRFIWALWVSLVLWGLILNAISPLLPSFWGFFDLGHGVSPQSRMFQHCTATAPVPTISSKLQFFQ